MMDHLLRPATRARQAAIAAARISIGLGDPFTDRPDRATKFLRQLHRRSAGRTNSTICRRNSGAYRFDLLDLDMADSPQVQIEEFNKAAQVQFRRTTITCTTLAGKRVDS
jgi:hypothetical protein